jgi:hypothetical protein
MKSIARPILALLALSGAAAIAQEIKKAESSSSSTEIKVGPVSVSVARSGHDGGKTAKTPYLGVVTAPVPPQLRAQLELPEGMGLSVEAVAQDSPAAKAGVRQYDVLKRFNDQLLCAQEQLSVLVNAAGKGAKISLVILRGGREQTVEVTLGEHDAPEGGRAQFSINGVPGVSVEVHDLDKMLKEGFTGGTIPDLLRHAFEPDAPRGGSAGIHQNWDEIREKNEQRQKEIKEQIERAIDKARAAAKNGGEAAEKAGAAGSAKAQVFSFYPGGQSRSVVSVVDADGTIELTDADGRRTVKIKDGNGTEIHSGPLNTEADHDAVPEKFRAKVKDAEGKLKTQSSASPKRKLEKKPGPPKAPGGAI